MYTILADFSLQGLKDLVQTIQEPLMAFKKPALILLALIVFWLLKKVAGIIKGLLLKGLNNTELDNKIAAKIGYKADISMAISTIAYLLLLIYAAVISLDIAQLGNASQPLVGMLDKFFDFVPNVFVAGVLLFFLLFIAKIVKQLLTNVLEVAKVDERLGSKTGTPIAKSLVVAAHGFLILLFIPPVLDALKIEAISTPLKGIIASVTSAIPLVLLAGVILAIGIIIGQVASRVVRNVLKGTGVDQMPAKIGFNLPTEGKGAVSSIVGTVVLLSIVVIVLGTALDSLKLGLLSGLSETMVSGYFNILLAVIVLSAGLVGAKFAYNALADKSACMAKIVRIVIIAISAVVALDRAGIASDLTSLPYKVSIYAAGVAFGIGGALAIGLGAREYVATWLRKRG